MEQDKACEVDLMSGPSDPYVDYNCKTGKLIDIFISYTCFSKSHVQ